MCKKMGNCCDRNEAQGNMCDLPHVDQEGVELYGKLECFMVDQCLNGSTFTDCLSEDVAPWGWLYPVYDPVSDLNYYNYRCAECNGVKDYIYWDLKLQSSFYEGSLSHCLRVLSGDKHKYCSIGFTPPKQMNIMDHVCSHALISSCNMSGLWAQYDAKLEQAFDRWFSPVLDVFGMLDYANIYCRMCNGWTYLPTDVCYGVAPPRSIHDISLSMTLDYKKVTRVINNPSTTRTGDTKNGSCGKSMVKHPSKVIYETKLHFSIIMIR